MPTMAYALRRVERRQRLRVRCGVPVVGQKLDRLVGACGLLRSRVPAGWHAWIDARIAALRATSSIRRSDQGRCGERGWVLIASNELTRSGAPKIVTEIADALMTAGYGVVVVAPLDGPLATTLVDAGATVVVDSAAFGPAAATLRTLARAALTAYCNTVVTDGAVRALHRSVRTIWYLHEVSLVTALFDVGRICAADFRMPHAVWCGSEQSAALVRPSRADVRVVPYGLAPLLPAPDEALSAGGDPIRIAIFASLEARKGQDLAVEALRLLPAEHLRRIRLTLYGRVLFPAFEKVLRETSDGLPVVFGGELDSDAYREAMRETDLVLVPSRDDTLPLVSLDALGSHRVLACTATTGTADYLKDGVNGFVAESPTAPSIAAMLSRTIERRADWETIAERGDEVFETHFSRDAFVDAVLEGVGDASG